MNDIRRQFEEVYHQKPAVACFAPGRVNLIGEHTDYNGGYVFPCAVHLGIYCAARRREDGVFRFYSANFPQEGIVSYEHGDRERRHKWTDYPVGVLRAFRAFGYQWSSGADFCFSGNLPDGAGLSSSAAIEVVTGTALRALYALPVTQQELALLGQFAENRFVGVNCGIMDQFASAMGKADCAILLHTGTLDYTYAPLKEAALVIVNSGVRHSLAASAYNDRRRECETAAKALSVSALCSISPAEWEREQHRIDDPVILKRARHVITENRRTIDAANALQRGDLMLFGRLMNESHRSLRFDYEVSCEELDFLADTAQDVSGVYGSRMTGGGFGGCTVSLMRPEAAGHFTAVITEAFRQKFGRIPDVYRVTVSDGAAVITD